MQQEIINIPDTQEIVKLIVTPDSLRLDSFALGKKAIDDNFFPDFTISIYRGGTPVSLPISELYKWLNIPTDCISIRTQRYTGIDQVSSVVQVHNLGYFTEKAKKTSKVLLIDDVFDTGVSIDAVFAALRERLGDKMPDDIRVATIYYKPSRNQTKRVPDYYIHETDQWIVFPHEIEGLSLMEIDKYFGTEIAQIVASVECKKVQKS